MTNRRLGRRELLATVAATSVGAGGFVGGTWSSFTDSETESDSLATGVWSDGSRLAYTTGGTLHTATESGTSSYGVGGVDVVGPVERGFDGSDYHVPVVDGNSDLLLVAADGTQTALDVSSKKIVRGTKSTLATATWNGHPLSVYYPGSNGSKLFRVAPGGTAARISKPSNGVKAALGAGDVDGDGTDEFLFVDGSGTVRYIVPSGKNNSRDIESTGISPGSNNNYGAGTPVAVDGYGVVVPAVNGSAGLGLLDADGWAEKSLTTGSTSKKSPVFGSDFDGDGSVEIAFVGYSSGELKYLDGVADTNGVESVTDASGSAIDADATRGVR